MKDSLSLFDAHCHLQDPRYDASRLEAALGQAQACGVEHMAVNGCRPSDWPSVKSLCAQHAQLVPSFGVHPWEVEGLADSWLGDLRRAIESTPGAMVGECGLDRCTRGKQVDWETQKLAFRRQLGLAKELGKTVSIHCVRAPAELESALAEAALTRPIILHSWVGSADSTAKLLKRFPSVLISLSGHLFQKPPAKAMDMVAVVPADRLLVESDAPDGLPQLNAAWRAALAERGLGEAALLRLARACAVEGPGVGAINTPASARLVLLTLAAMRGVEPEELSRVVHATTCRAFDVPERL